MWDEDLKDEDWWETYSRAPDPPGLEDMSIQDLYDEGLEDF